MLSRLSPIMGIVFGSSLASGCATISQNAGFSDVAKTFELRTGLQLQQYAGDPTGIATDAIDRLLHKDVLPSDGPSEYVCPMHPDVRQNQPGSCPKCGMTLKPLDSRKMEEGGGDQQSESEGAMESQEYHEGMHHH